MRDVEWFVSGTVTARQRLSPKTSGTSLRLAAPRSIGPFCPFEQPQSVSMQPDMVEEQIQVEVFSPTANGT